MILLRRPGGFTILEVAAAAAVLAVILGVVVPLFLLTEAQRRETRLHRQAVEVADNLLERVLALDWQDIQDDVPDEVVQAEELLEGIRAGTWKLQVVEASGPVPAKRVTISVSYRAADQHAAVRLTTWVYAELSSDIELVPKS